VRELARCALTPALSHAWEREEKCFANVVADLIDISQHVMISKAQNANLCPRKLLGAASVVVQALGLMVMRSVQLEREASLGTVEVQHESALGMLTPKLETRERSASQTCPKKLLCNGRIPAQFARNIPNV